MIPDLSGKRFVILGLQGSGKSYLAKHILATEPRHLVYDTMHEHAGCHRYIPDYRQGPEAIEELNLAVNRLVITSGKVRMFVLDEANRFCPPKPKPLPESILALNDWNRHMGIAFGCIARRPVQLHTDLVELAHFLFAFRLVGRNDQGYLADLVPGLEETVSNLDPYSFAIVDQERRVQVHPPMPEIV